MTDVVRIKEALRLISQGISLFEAGPQDYDLDNLAACYELLISRFAPFKVGDEAALAKTPTIDEKTSWGWIPAKHYLRKGALCTVREVSCGVGGFYFYVSFADESWINSTTKKVNPTPHQHHYRFGEDWLARPEP